MSSILSSSYLDICQGIVDGALSSTNVSLIRHSMQLRVAGYGTAPQAGKPIEVDEMAIAEEGRDLLCHGQRRGW